MRRMDEEVSERYLTLKRCVVLVGVVVIAMDGDKVLLGKMVGMLTQQEINQIGGELEIDECKKRE